MQTFVSTKGGDILLTGNDIWAKPISRGLGHKSKNTQSMGSFSPKLSFTSAARNQNSNSLGTEFFSKRLQTSKAVPHSALGISVMERRRWHSSLFRTRRVSSTKSGHAAQPKFGSSFIHPFWVYSQIVSRKATPDSLIVASIVFLLLNFSQAVATRP